MARALPRLDRVTFQLGDVLRSGLKPASYDVVWTQHSNMNIEDKEQLYAEAYRVLRSRGRLALHEIMAGPVQPIHFPVPWAAEPSISFLRPAEVMRRVIAAAGFEERVWMDVTEPSIHWFRERLAASGGGSPPHLGLHLLLGPLTAQAFPNILRNLEEGRAVVVEAVFQKR